MVYTAVEIGWCLLYMLCSALQRRLLPSLGSTSTEPATSLIFRSAGGPTNPRVPVPMPVLQHGGGVQW